MIIIKSQDQTISVIHISEDFMYNDSIIYHIEFLCR